MSDPAAAKKALRQVMFARRGALAPPARQAAARQLAGHAEAVLACGQGRAISGFCSVFDEIEPSLLLERLAGLGAALLLPRVAGRHLTFHRWAPGDPLVPGRYGIPEPLADTSEALPALMLVPLVGFDRRGNRLGYGGGFFDRVLADYQPEATIGVAYSVQEAPEIPVEAHDQPLDYVLTEHGLIDCRGLRGA